MNATQHPTHNKPFALLQAVVVLAAVVMLAGAAAIGLLRAFGWTAQQSYAIYAGLVCGGTAIIALVPVWWLSRKSIQGAAMGFLAGMVVRMAVCGLAVVIGGRLEGVEAMPWSLWIAGWYMLALTVEVGLVGRYIAGSKVTTTSQDVNAECRATQ